MNQDTNNTQTVDVLVVGGGVNGAGVALDAAGRGLSVVLCEKGDLAGATSSSSSKLIHGGLRYLEHYEFRLVKEALAEREVLLQKAPHIMWPLRFRLPHQKHLRPAWMIRIGLFLYDSLAKRNMLPRSKKMSTSPTGPLVNDISTCFEYSDGWVDDARLVVLNALAAQEKGATIHTRTECISAEKQDDLWKVTLKDIEGKTFTVLAKAVVNAAGPWAVSFLDRLADTKNPNAMRMVKGSHFIVPKLYDTDEAYILQNKDDRIVFVIPYEDDFSLVGTTDENYVGEPTKAAISEAETDYLVDVVNTYFKSKITPDDIVHSYSGVRPLLEEANASAQELTRDYKVELSGTASTPILLNIFGGKITTYRKLAEHAVDKLVTLFPKAGKAWTKEVPLPGGAFADKATLLSELKQDYPWLPAEVCVRYVRQYGLLCKLFLSGKTSLSEMGEDFGSQFFQAEVDYLIEKEWALTLEDVIWRRTKHGLRLTDSQKSHLESYLATNTGKSTKASTANFSTEDGLKQTA
ncbi:glycerol-3-phosphate dehydrogenase [Alteromonas sp. 1_MG-2023]|uniref:glycerol-3-phosphate dehydrogenase n=1 Tax=Alteromonas sp. 1_MG-2023 TaxID=3062669 RepID=UPI0026E14A35|nr:glycerol-3-phosphate dehydrogenase [Alteromonas sp. 1_MG-2023]MDO6566681.1 glycerol-3-phosphate dehydrogenase [Alteromonas sp. 1_MG-2023]